MNQAERAWRVLHILDHGPPTRDGYVARTLAIAAAQRGFGWQPLLLAGPRQRGTPDGAATGGCALLRMPAAPARPAALRPLTELRIAARHIAAAARRLAPDILHAHSPALLALPALRVGRALGIPVVYEVRAFWEDAAAADGRGAVGGPRWHAIRALDTFLFRRVGAVVALSAGLRDDILARGIDPARVGLVANGVDLARFASLRQDPAAGRHALGLPDRPTIGYVGSLNGYEGVDLLIDAAARLRDRRPPIGLLIVGDGGAAAALRIRAAQAGLGERVVFAGPVAGDRVVGHYAACDAVAYPRRAVRLTELVTPLKPLEAMALGRFVMASDVGGHRELVADGRTGHLFPADDPAALAAAIDRVLARDADWSAMRAAARRHVEECRPWPRVAAAYAGLYARAAAAR